MADPDITYAVTDLHLVVRLKRPDMGTASLQVKLKRVKLASSNAGEACDYVENCFSSKLYQSGRQFVTLQECALIGAIMRDFFHGKLRPEGGIIGV